MKLTASKLFDFALIAATKAGPEIKAFIDYTNSNFEKIIRAISGELTLDENVKGQMLSVQLQHGIATTVSVRSLGINGIVPMSCQNDAVTGLNWEFDNKGGVSLTAYFQSATTTKRTCTFFVYFK